MTRLAYLLCLLVPAAAVALPASAVSLLKRHAGFTDQELADVQRGERVVKTINTGSRPEIAVAGISRFPVSLSTYLHRLRAGTLYKIRDPLLQVGLFHQKPSTKDLKTLTFASCDLDASAEENKRWLIASIQKHEETGQTAFGPLGERPEPVDAALLLKNAGYLRERLPAAYEYLLRYPNVPSAAANDFYFWSQLTFGIRPVTRLAQVSVWEDRPGEAIVVTKQIYANRYIQSSYQIDHLISDDSDPQHPGVFLITFNFGRSNFLSGWSGKMIRPLVVSRTRAMAEKTLDEARQDFEQEFRKSL